MFDVFPFGISSSWKKNVAMLANDHKTKPESQAKQGLRYVWKSYGGVGFVIGLPPVIIHL